MSDNGTTSVCASQHLKRLFESPSVQETLRRQGTEWHFILKCVPLFGVGLIGLTKTALKEVLGRAFVTIDTLQTVITEIEAMLNNRPLTTVPSGSDDLEPLTPSHLLYGRRLTTLPYKTVALEFGHSFIAEEHSALTKRAKLQSTILNQFWKRWRMEYLTALRETNRKLGTNTQTIAVGNVVQIHDECPRSRWKLSGVKELMSGKDDLAQAAEV